MSDINNGIGRAFVRDRYLPQLPPPPSTTGIIGWLRGNLFSSPLNAALTVASFYLLYLIIPPFFDWAFLESGWFGKSNKSCSDLSGACWAVVTARFGQFLFGFYPEDERWRPILVMIIFAISLSIGIGIRTTTSSAAETHTSVCHNCKQ